MKLKINGCKLAACNRLKMLFYYYTCNAFINLLALSFANSRFL